MRISDSTVYLTDNGAAYCGAHLGASAKATGRDISGQPIVAVTADVARQANAECGYVPTCEHPKCGRVASLLHGGAE